MRDTLRSFQPHLFPAEIAFANSSSLNTKAILFEEVRPSPSPGGWPPGQRPEVVKGTPSAPLPTSSSCSQLPGLQIRAGWQRCPWCINTAVCLDRGGRGRPVWGSRVSSQLVTAACRGSPSTEPGLHASWHSACSGFLLPGPAPCSPGTAPAQSAWWVGDGHASFRERSGRRRNYRAMDGVGGGCQPQGPSLEGHLRMKRHLYSHLAFCERGQACSSQSLSPVYI